MKNLLDLRAFVFAAWVIVGFESISFCGQSTMDAISGHVLGASGTHTVYVTLWDSTGFMKQAVRQIRLQPGTEKAFSFNVAPGRWAVSAFEDRNDNGILDMGLFGPKEPSGFWRPFHAKRKPRFDDVAVRVDHTVSDADVKLH